MSTRYALAVVTKDAEQETHIWLVNDGSNNVSYDTEQAALDDYPIGKVTATGNVLSRTPVPYNAETGS